MRSIDEFFEPLDHEFENITPLPDKLQGVKLDDSFGLKQHCKFQQLKSADYLMFTPKGQHYLIEFSDIGRQIASTQQDIDTINSSSLPKPLQTRLKKRLKRSVTQEVRDKYLNTCTLLYHAANIVSGIPQKLVSGCHFLVVYAPFSAPIKGSEEELIKFIDYMKKNLQTAIPDAMFHRVEIITLDTFMKRYY